MSSKRPAAATAVSSIAKKEKLNTGDKEVADANDDTSHYFCAEMGIRRQAPSQAQGGGRGQAKT